MSAPAFRTFTTSSPRRAKSADKIEGAIQSSFIGDGSLKKKRNVWNAPIKIQLGNPGSNRYRGAFRSNPNGLGIFTFGFRTGKLKPIKALPNRPTSAYPLSASV
jgi:hypothetical protein